MILEAMKTPTQEMILAGAMAMNGVATSGGGSVIMGQPKDVFTAMIQAAQGSET